ncbi:MAG TPA: BolA family protein [Methylovirgula sp.]
MNAPTKGDSDATFASRITKKLRDALTPSVLEVIDESHKHAKHAHAMSRAGTAEGAGETHFRIKVVSDSFTGKSRVERHRMINDLLAAELAERVHALAIETKAPGDDNAGAF